MNVERNSVWLMRTFIQSTRRMTHHKVCSRWEVQRIARVVFMEIYYKSVALSNIDPNPLYASTEIKYHSVLLAELAPRFIYDNPEKR